MTTSESLAKTTYTPRGGLALSCAILLFCMLLALLPVAGWASASHGWPGVQAAAVAWLLCTVAAFAALLISVSFASTPLAASANHGWTGVQAAGVAWVLCTGAAFAALFVSVSFASTPLAPSANLGSMGIRMGIPLFGLIVLPNAAPSLAAAGLLPSLLACYLVALVVETLLALRHVAPNPTPASASASSPPLEAK